MSIYYCRKKMERTRGEKSMTGKYLNKYQTLSMMLIFNLIISRYFNIINIIYVIEKISNKNIHNKEKEEEKRSIEIKMKY